METNNFEKYTITCGLGNEEEIVYIKTGDNLMVAPEENFWTLAVNNSKWATIPITDINSITTISSGPCEPRPLRITCEYCGCVSKKDYGTCEHCGAPLVPLEYIY